MTFHLDKIPWEVSIDVMHGNDCGSVPWFRSPWDPSSLLPLMCCRKESTRWKCQQPSGIWENVELRSKFSSGIDVAMGLGLFPSDNDSQHSLPNLLFYGLFLSAWGQSRYRWWEHTCFCFTPCGIVVLRWHISMTGRRIVFLGRWSLRARCEYFWRYKPGSVPSGHPGHQHLCLPVGCQGHWMDFLLLVVPHAPV